jgi:1-acyl-sn-glycerol-3-phosphate acyltransferase
MTGGNATGKGPIGHGAERDLPAGLRSARGDSGLSVGLFYGASLLASRLAAVGFFSLHAERVHRVPRTGPVILAANHQSFLDPWLVGLCLERRAHYLARDSLFRVPILGWAITRYGALPVPRESAAPRRALEVCLMALERGRALVLFPEGTRSSDGVLQPLRRGIALLARRAAAPVVPVLVAGSHRAWPRARRLPRRSAVRLFFGNPIRFGEDESSDSFMERLASAFRALALEAGEESLLPAAARGDEAEGEGSWPEGGSGSSSPPLPFLNEEERSPLLEAAGVGRQVSLPRKALERPGSTAAAAQPSLFGES